MIYVSIYIPICHLLSQRKTRPHAFLRPIFTPISTSLRFLQLYPSLLSLDLHLLIPYNPSYLIPLYLVGGAFLIQLAHQVGNLSGAR